MVHGAIAPSRREREGYGTISDSSYSSVAPKPLHRSHAPRGLLNENSCGVGAGARVPSLAHSYRSVKRADATGLLPTLGTSTGSVNMMTQSPSPSRKAVPTASGKR